jgi:hypothetical protein
MINGGLQKTIQKTEGTCICKNILKITIIWDNELFNGKGLKAKHMIFVGLLHSNAGKHVKKDRQCNGQTKKDKMINGGLQKTIQKTED